MSLISNDLVTIPVDMNQFDVFTQKSLQNLDEERRVRQMTLYIGRVVENNTAFYFDGSKFFEYYMKNGKAPSNPLTKRQIREFTILKASDAPGRFSLYLNQAEATPFRYLPILLNDPEREGSERGDFYERLGTCYARGDGCAQDNDRAMFYYEKGIEQGDIRCHLNLSRIYIRKERYPEALSWTTLYLNKARNPLVSEYIQAAQLFELCENEENRDASMFMYYHLGACKGNPFCIAKVISFYESGFGVTENRDKAAAWRAFLKPEWREKEIGAIVDELSENPDFDATANLNIPEYLAAEEANLKWA